MRLAHLPDVVVGCEVSASLPRARRRRPPGRARHHAEQHAEIDRRRHDVAVLLPYLREQQIFTVINHVASQVNGRLTAALIASLLPWVDAFEVRNGSRLRVQNRTAEALAAATGKLWIGGSDSHTGRGIGQHLHGRATMCTTREAFMAGLRAGRGRVEGRHGWYFTMASDLMRFAGRFYEEKALRVVDAAARLAPARCPARRPRAHCRRSRSRWSGRPSTSSKRRASTDRSCSTWSRVLRLPALPPRAWSRPRDEGRHLHRQRPRSGPCVASVRRRDRQRTATARRLSVSADLMERNLDCRVATLCRIATPTSTGTSAKLRTYRPKHVPLPHRVVAAGGCPHPALGRELDRRRAASAGARRFVSSP